jgi:hypothetical protein
MRKSVDKTSGVDREEYGCDHLERWAKDAFHDTLLHMRRSFKLCSLVIIVVSLSGCVTRPPGISKTEWNSMSPEKQAEYRKLRTIYDQRPQPYFDVFGEHRRATSETIRAIESRVTNLDHK